MSEILIDCPSCRTTGFTIPGFRSHRCKGGTHRNPETGMVDVSAPLSVLAKQTLLAQATKAQHPAAEASEVEVMPPAEAAAADLSAAAQLINDTIDGITSHEEAFEEATLEPRLIIGLEIYRAQQAFGLTKAEGGAIGGSMSQRDMLTDPVKSHFGLMGWLKREIPRLKRPTALKYSIAFQALGLDSTTASPAAIRERVKKLRHEAGKKNLPMPTLSSLYRSWRPAPLQIEENATKPSRLHDAREFWGTWRAEGEDLVHKGWLDHLDKPGLEQLKDFNLWLRDRLSARLKNI